MPDGESLFVREYGQGQPVLVLSGLGMLCWQWAAFLYPHRHRFHFIIPEWRGFGTSTQCKIPQLDAISSHWQDVACLIEQMQLKHVIVIAYSMGATTTMHGLKYGNFAKHIQAYLHIDQTPKITVDQEWPYGLFADQHHNFKAILQSVSELLVQHPDIIWLNNLPKDAQQQLASLWLRFIALQNNNPLSLKGFAWALKYPKLQAIFLPSKRLDYTAWYIRNYLYHDQDYRDALKQLNCPVTFFSGVQSKLYPIEGQSIIAKSLPQAKQIRFEKSGHTPLINEPIKFAQEIKKFLQAYNLYTPPIA